MKAGTVTFDWKNRRFVQLIEYGTEDGLPEGYTLFLEYTAHPADPGDEHGTVYADGDFGSWGYSPQTLTLAYREKSEGRDFKELIDLDVITKNSFSWLDIYSDIILYSSTGCRYENFVLYNIKTKAKKVVTAESYIQSSAWDLESFDHFREPTLWVQDDIVYVWFEAVDGWYDGGENVGKKVMCFKKDTLEQLSPSACPLDSYDIEEVIDENRGKEYKCANGSYKSAVNNINLCPDAFYNKYDIKSITEMYHRTVHHDGKFKEFPKSLIKQMKKARLEYAKANNLEIEPGKIHLLRTEFYEWLYKLFGKLQNKAFQRKSKIHNKYWARKRKEKK